MPRIRSVKPELWQSPQVMNLSAHARLLFIGLITQADDFGRGSADLRKLKAAIFPGDDCTPAKIQGWLTECAAERLAVLYRHDEHGDLYALPTWDDHQYVPKRAERSRFPPPPKATGGLPEDSGSTTVGSERKGRERKGKEGAAGAADDSPGQAPEAVPEPPPGLDPAAWKRWREYRTEIRKPLKPVSIPAAQRELAAYGCEQAQVVEQSIANGWQGLFPLKRTNGKHAPAEKPKRERPPTPDEIADARRKAAADSAETIRKLGLAPIAAMPR